MPGVLFEGGSFRPIFSCGVMDALLEEDIMFPYCIGVSAGAADAASYISRQKERNIRIFLNYRNDKRYFGAGNLIREKSPFGIDFVFREMNNEIEPFDIDAFQRYEGKFVITTTDACTGQVHYFYQSDVDRDYMVFQASCALPVIFPPVEIGGREYYDGGLSNPIPIDKLVRDGHKRALVVLTRPKGYEKVCTSSDRMSARAIRHKYPRIAQRILTRHKRYNRAVEVCEELERRGRIVLIRPERRLNSYEKDVEILRKNYEYGYDMARERMEEIRRLF